MLNIIEKSWINVPYPSKNNYFWVTSHFKCTVKFLILFQAEQPTPISAGPAVRQGLQQEPHQGQREGCGGADRDPGFSWPHGVPWAF